MVLAAVCGCAGTQPVSPPALTGAWDVVELGGEEVAEKHRPTLRFEDGRVSGSTGCNQFQGSFEQKGAALSFGPLASTRRYCEESAEIETRFLAALDKVNAFRLARDKVRLLAGDDVLATLRPTGHELAPYR